MDGSSREPLLSPASSSSDGDFGDPQRLLYGAVVGKDNAAVTTHPVDVESGPQDGVQQADAINLVWSRAALILAYCFIFLCSFANALQWQVMSNLMPYVVSEFSSHSLIPTIGIVASIMSGVLKLPIAKMIDSWGRPQGLAFMIALATAGLVLMALCQSVKSYAAAEVIYQVGISGFSYVLDIIVADTSSLKNRALAFAFNSSPNLITTFIGPPIARAFYEYSNWRWAFGISAVTFIVLSIPVLYLLLLHTRKAIAAGLLLKEEKNEPWSSKSLQRFLVDSDAIGICLITMGMTLVLVPFSLVGSRESTHAFGLNAVLVFLGIALVVAFVIHERKTLRPFLKFSLLLSPNVAGACLLSIAVFVAYFSWDGYYTSYLQVVHDLSITEAGYVGHIYGFGSCIWAGVVGYLIRRTDRFKWIAWAALPVHILGGALMIIFRRPDTNMTWIIMCQVLITIGGSTLVVCEQMAVMVVANHSELASVLALLSLCSYIGSAMGSSLSGAIWNTTLPEALAMLLPDLSQEDLAWIGSDLAKQLSYPMGDPSSRMPRSSETNEIRFRWRHAGSDDPYIKWIDNGNSGRKMATQTIVDTPSVQPQTQRQRLSLLYGPVDPPLVDLTLGELLDLQCQHYGTQECIVTPWTGARWTYNELNQQSSQLARALMSLGIGVGDRVGIMAGNCEQYASVFFAVARIGAILVILNNTYTPTEAQYALKFTDCKVFFTTKKIGKTDNRKLLAELADQKQSPDVVILRGESGAYPTYDDLIKRGRTLSNGHLYYHGWKVLAHNVCNLQFTSGTTGSPKAAMLTHHNIVNNARFIGDRMRLTPDDILCCPPPLFHCFGLVLGLMAVITHGAKIVYPEEVFDAAAVLRAISDERCTAVHGVPAMFDTLFSLPPPPGFNCERLRTGIIAGAPVPRYLMELLVERFGMTEFTSSYGLTEASPTCFNAFTDDAVERRLTTVGTIMPHARAKIVDHEGRVVPVGARGELCMAGYQLQAGYWNNSEKTAEVMVRDEAGVLWLHTGDEAIFDDEGYCTITGRFKDIIIRGGENIYPLEIEERLVAHPDVSRAIVTGLKDAHYGEVVGAFLQSGKPDQRPTDQEVRDWVRQKLGRHKAPTHVFWLGEDGVPADVPLTGSGKVKKYEMARFGEEILRKRRLEKL
ncbi:hypothetical protein DL764_005951 [Monosporascus ibericus]|uniref:Major facilitator superfamily (MFS) profile domain-containing protein n=1 Tax=Monosporascus ibericus TaxID=155417 RepID=A0A4Q4T6X2_9PEZI|nr:hypothetical protein DL764_005951 [Monosporascus ibericus]